MADQPAGEAIERLGGRSLPPATTACTPCSTGAPAPAAEERSGSGSGAIDFAGMRVQEMMKLYYGEHRKFAVDVTRKAALQPTHLLGLLLRLQAASFPTRRCISGWHMAMVR